MIDYISERQLSIEEFKTPFQTTSEQEGRIVLIRLKSGVEIEIPL